ncbi:MAG TPA: N-acetylmuramoyl-L-alanine amidase [Candidatus Hydrogenedentes bacterium]|nr:N-acetylmuramoyl-L-alanine amidase [Candidatus Hydrogenedentota bacterium]HPG69947.1 N-acetylmuramoyl-L-alanine amidase [Candidatus Hydrogenedentota bacterium]
MKHFLSLLAVRWVWAMTAAWALVLATATVGQTSAVVFRTRLDGSDRVATAPIVDVGGIPHVSLLTVARDLGGDGRVQPGRVQLDFARQTAWMKMGDTRVDGSLNQFPLQHPLSGEGDRVLMALVDVIPFFAKAFRVAVIRAESDELATLPEGAAADGHVSASEVPASSPSDESLWEPVALPGDEPKVGSPEDTRGERPQEPVVSTPSTALPRVSTVILDAGHGGKDVGSLGAQGVKEKDVALAVTRCLKEELGTVPGLKVEMTRSDDTDLSSRDRANTANSRSGDLLISIHTGASLSPTAHGIEVFFSTGTDVYKVVEGKDSSPPPADYSMVCGTLGERIASKLAESSGAENRGISDVRCKVLKDVSMPALLIEVGFLTNMAEEELLGMEAYQRRLAQGIAAGIKDYLTQANRMGRDR